MTSSTNEMHQCHTLHMSRGEKKQKHTPFAHYTHMHASLRSETAQNCKQKGKMKGREVKSGQSVDQPYGEIDRCENVLNFIHILCSFAWKSRTYCIFEGSDAIFIPQLRFSLSLREGLTPPPLYLPSFWMNVFFLELGMMCFGLAVSSCMDICVYITESHNNNNYAIEFIGYVGLGTFGIIGRPIENTLVRSRAHINKPYKFVKMTAKLWKAYDGREGGGGVRQMASKQSY